MGYIGGSTKCEIYLYPSQTGGDGNRRTVKVRFEAKLKGGSNSYFGYPADYRIWVDGSASSWNRLKGGETWRGDDSRRAFEQSLTIDVGTSSSKAITVGVELRSDSSSWNGKYTENFWVDQTNIAPTQPGWLQIRATTSSGPVLSGTISENINIFYASWASSSDGNGDTIYYDLQEQRNGGSWASIDGNGTDTAHQFPTTGGEGTSYSYCVNARDNKGGASEWTYSGVITKNVFTMATLSSSSSISYHGDPLTFTYSGGNNTQSGVGINYSISCKEITLYNGGGFSSGGQVKINWGQGGGTSGAYVNWGDIVNYFQSSGGKGRLTFVLTGQNGNGTTKTSEASIAVNIQTKPDTVSGATISTNSSESTAYRKLASNGQWYFLPDGSRKIRIKWNPVSGNYGDTITYKVFIAYEDGGWREVVSGLTQTYYDHVMAKPSRQITFKYLIRAVSSGNGGLYSEVQTSTQTAHIYNEPSLIVDSVDRKMNNATVKFRIYGLTSLPNISTTGSWSCNGSRGTLNSFGSQTVNLSGLVEDKTYTMTVTYNDNSGLSSGEKTGSIPVGASKPVFFVNKHGVGIGGVKASSTHALTVSGGTLIEQGAQINGGLTVGQIESSNLVAGTNVTGTSNGGGNANLVWRSGFYSAVNGKNYPTSTGTYYLLNVANIDNMPSKRHNIQFASEMGTQNLYFRNTQPDGSGNWKLLGGGGGAPDLTDNTAKRQLLDMIYPVGAIYMSTSSTNPGSTLGGSWVRWGQGRVPVGLDESDYDYNSPNSTGGSESSYHSHSSGNLTAAIGAYDLKAGNLGYENATALGSNGFTYGFRHSESSSEFDKLIPSHKVSNGTRIYGSTSGTSSSTVQPYVVCYMWRRTQ